MTGQSPPTPEKAHPSKQTPKRLEDELWKAAQRFRSLIEHSTDIVVILDADGCFRYVSPSTTKILGYVPEDLIGKTIFEFTHPNDASIVTDTINQALQQPGAALPEIEYCIQHSDGAWHTFAATLTNLLDDLTVNGLLLNCHDITDRKQVEEELRQSEQRFRQVISSISDHIYATRVTEEGRRLNQYISPNVEDLTGYPREKFLEDQNFWPSTVIHPEDRGAALTQMARLDMGRDSEMEYRLIRADGKIIWVRDCGKVYDEGDSKIIYGVVSDITGRKQLEEQFRQAQKMEAIGRLAGGIAHDFNNLLTVIIGSSEIVLDTLSNDDPLRSDIERIRETGDRAATLTRQLLAFSRKQMLHPEVLDLNTVVSNLDKMLRRLIGEDIDLLIAPGPDLGQVKADPGQMEQVIMNLVVNARDAMPQGGTLTIETANVNLDQSYTRQRLGLKSGLYVMLAVSDTGHGMDEETKAHIFEPFFTTKEQDQGTGLGLATVHGIINQSGGHIWVYSEPGQGATFKVYLPRVQEVGQSTIQEQAIDESLQGSETILLVEDENMVRELAHHVLLKEGYTVLKARYGAEALQICERYKGSIDLLLTDVVMPGRMSGFQLAERLIARRPAIKVLYMSGYTDKAITNHGVLDPKKAFLEKPFTPKTLLRKVRQILDEA